MQQPQVSVCDQKTKKCQSFPKASIQGLFDFFGYLLSEGVEEVPGVGSIKRALTRYQAKENPEEFQAYVMFFIRLYSEFVNRVKAYHAWSTERKVKLCALNVAITLEKMIVTYLKDNRWMEQAPQPLSGISLESVRSLFQSETFPEHRLTMSQLTLFMEECLVLLATEKQEIQELLLQKRPIVTKCEVPSLSGLTRSRSRQRRSQSVAKTS